MNSENGGQPTAAASVPRATDPQPQAASKLQDHEGWSFRFEMLVAISTVIMTAGSLYQGCLTRESLKATRDGIALSRDSLALSERALQVSERARLWIDEPDDGVELIPTRSPQRVRLELKNAGNAMATQVRTVGGFLYRPAPWVEPDECRDCVSCEAEMVSDAMVPPGEKTGFDFEFRAFSEEEIVAVKNESLFIYRWVLVSYDDGFGNTRHLSTCSRYHAGKSSWYQCSRHGYAD